MIRYDCNKEQGNCKSDTAQFVMKDFLHFQMALAPTDGRDYGRGVLQAFLPTSGDEKEIFLTFS